MLFDGIRSCTTCLGRAGRHDPGQPLIYARRDARLAAGDLPLTWHFHQHPDRFVDLVEHPIDTTRRPSSTIKSCSANFCVRAGWTAITGTNEARILVL